MGDSVATFFSSFYALRGEKTLHKHDIPCKLIPSPRELSASCAVSLTFEASLVESVADLLARNRVQVEAIYIYEGTGRGRKPRLWNG